MKVSLLNERITIEKSKIEVDKIGNNKNVWSKFYSCHATISSESRRKKQVAVLYGMKARLILPFASVER